MNYILMIVLASILALLALYYYNRGTPDSFYAESDDSSTSLPQPAEPDEQARVKILDPLIKDQAPIEFANIEIEDMDTVDPTNIMAEQADSKFHADFKVGEETIDSD